MVRLAQIAVSVPAYIPPLFSSGPLVCLPTCQANSSQAPLWLGDPNCCWEQGQWPLSLFPNNSGLCGGAVVRVALEEARLGVHGKWHLSPSGVAFEVPSLAWKPLYKKKQSGLRGLISKGWRPRLGLLWLGTYLKIGAMTVNIFWIVNSPKNQWGFVEWSCISQVTWTVEAVMVFTILPWVAQMSGLISVFTRGRHSNIWNSCPQAY